MKNLNRRTYKWTDQPTNKNRQCDSQADRQTGEQIGSQVTQSKTDITQRIREAERTAQEGDGRSSCHIAVEKGQCSLLLPVFPRPSATTPTECLFQHAIQEKQCKFFLQNFNKITHKLNDEGLLLATTFVHKESPLAPRTRVATSDFFPCVCDACL